MSWGAAEGSLGSGSYRRSSATCCVRCTTTGPSAPSEALRPTVVGTVVPATVPGCVHPDLLAAGLIPDPYLDANEAELSWIGYVDWRYETTVHLSRDDCRNGTDRLDLVSDGLDTLATSSQRRRARPHRNQHRSYRIDLRGAVREGDNTLAITFAAACRPSAPSLPPTTPTRQRPPVQRHPQDGLQFRLGLGRGSGDRRHLAPDLVAPLGNRAHRIGAAARRGS